VGDSIRLRPLTFDDWPAVHDWSRLPESCRYQQWGPNTSEQTQAYVRIVAEAWRAPQPKRFGFAVLLDDLVVGTADLHLRGGGQGEIGYGIHPDRWGRGIGTEVARQLLDLAFGRHGLHRVFATCDPRNVASGRVLVKSGMTREGRMRETVLIRDGWRDSDLYAILDREWSPAPVAGTTPGTTFPPGDAARCG
jgi:ribosomal-protein-alanine N-acetyltransferase